MTTKILAKFNLRLAYLMAHTIILSIASLVTSEHQIDERGLNNRIIGGKVADAKRYPYYAYLEIIPLFGFSFTCGGSLVQCIDVDTYDIIYSINVYVNYTQSISVTGYFTGYEHIRSGITYIKHKDYNKAKIVNDIGLIILDTPVNAVKPVYLNSNGNLPSVGDPLTVFGHGKISNAETPEFPYYLMEVSVPVVSFQDCNDQNSYTGSIVDQSMICAGVSVGGKGTCNGDSGGPLIIRGNAATEDIQVGIVSFGSKLGCSIVNYPSVFTRVSYFTQWLQANICYHSKVPCGNVSQPTRMPVVATPPTPKRRPTLRPTPSPTKKIVRTRRPTPQPTPQPTEAPIATPVTSPLFDFPVFV
jgi:secreted trypsin-like serine protease